MKIKTYVNETPNLTGFITAELNLPIGTGMASRAAAIRQALEGQARAGRQLHHRPHHEATVRREGRRRLRPRLTGDGA